MFKSVFAKYVTVVMAILVIGFSVLLIVITSIVSHSLSESKATDMDEVGTAVMQHLSPISELSDPQDFISRVCDGEEAKALRLDDLFQSLVVTDPDMQVLIADSHGTVFYRVGNQSVYKESSVSLPAAAITDLYVGKVTYEIVPLKEFFPSEVLLRTCGVYSASGELVGYVSVTSSVAPNGRVMLDLTKTVGSSVLLVLLAALIAVYVISERVTSPLREMRSASRKFALGSFETRVMVHGNDEVAELALAFNNMADSLENLEKMRSSFIANVSHDLRTPMTTIAGFIDGIRDGVIPPEEQDHYLEVISMEVQRLSRLVTSLLDLSRIQAGDRKFTPEPFDICEMARLILISFEQRIEEKHLNVAFECDEDRMLILADHDAIYQVFYNLCHNALKFSRDGGLLRLSISEKDKKICVSVYNEGEGIPKEDLPFVFERFYKSDKSRGLDKTGTGLGLYISKTIVEAHGERIWAASEEGQNCEFFFTMPKAPHA